MAPDGSHITALVERLKADGYEVNDELAARAREMDARQTVPLTYAELLTAAGVGVIFDAVFRKAVHEAVKGFLATEQNEPPPLDSKFLKPWTPPKRPR